MPLTEKQIEQEILDLLKHPVPPYNPSPEARVLALKAGEIHAALFNLGMEFNRQFLTGPTPPIKNQEAYLKACEPLIARLSEGCHLRTQDVAACRKILDALGLDEPAGRHSAMRKIFEALKADDESHYAVVMIANIAVDSTKPGNGEAHADIGIAHADVAGGLFGAGAGIVFGPVGIAGLGIWGAAWGSLGGALGSILFR